MNGAVCSAWIINGSGKNVHRWGTNERVSVLVRYVTLCEKKCVNVSPLLVIPRQQQVQIPRSSLDGSELCGMSGPNRLKRSWMCFMFECQKAEKICFFFFLFLRGVCWRGWRLERASLSQSLPSPAPSHRGVSCSRSQNWKLIQSPLNGASLNWVLRT